MPRLHLPIALAALTALGLSAAPAGAASAKVSYRTGKAVKVSPSAGYVFPELEAGCRSAADKALTVGWSGLPLLPSVTSSEQASGGSRAQGTVKYVGGAARASTARAGVLCAKGTKVKVRRRGNLTSGKVSCGSDYAVGNPIGPNSAREPRPVDEQGTYVSRPSGTHGWISDLTLDEDHATDVNCVSKKAFSGVKIVREKGSLAGTTTKRVTASCPRRRSVIGWGVELPHVPSNRVFYDLDGDATAFAMTVMQTARPTSGNRGWSVTFTTPDGKPFVEDALQTRDYLSATVYAVCAKPR